MVICILLKIGMVKFLVTSHTYLIVKMYIEILEVMHSFLIITSYYNNYNTYILIKLKVFIYSP